MRIYSALLIGSLLASQAVGAVVFRDNFENVTGGTAPFPQAGFDGNPVAQVGSWTIQEPGITNVQVTTDYSPPEGTRALVTNRDGTGGAYSRANLSTASPTVPSDGLTISFKYKDMQPDAAFSNTVDIIDLVGRNASDTNWDNQLFEIRIYKGWGSSASDVLVGFGGTGSLTSPESSGATFAGAGDPNSNWLQVDIDMNFVNHTYTFKLNGSSVAGSTNIPFDGDGAAANQMQQFIFAHYYSDQTRYGIDDVTISTVPEPGMGMMLLGLAATAMRRRGKR